MNYEEITEGRYDELLNVMPVIYVSKVDDKVVGKGFAIAEANDYNTKGVVLTICFRTDSRYFMAKANLLYKGRFIGDNYSELEYSTGSLAYTIPEPVTRDDTNPDMAGTPVDRYREITEERYEDLYEVLPIVFVQIVDNEPVERGFAVCEACDYNQRGVVLTVCFQRNGKYYMCEANLRDQNGYITDYMNRAYHRNLIADTVHRKRKTEAVI